MLPYSLQKKDDLYTPIWAQMLWIQICLPLNAPLKNLIDYTVLTGQNVNFYKKIGATYYFFHSYRWLKQKAIHKQNWEGTETLNFLISRIY